MWAGIIVMIVVLGLFLLATVVMSGSIGRLRHGDKPSDPGGPSGHPPR